MEKNMMHVMKIENEAFERIMSHGIEFRVLDDTCREIKAGDQILFNMGDDKHIVTYVEKLYLPIHFRN